MPEPICPICSHQPVRYKFTFKAYPLYRCPACGTQFLFPQPDDQVLEQIYSADYFLTDGTPAGVERMRKMKQATAAVYVKKLLQKTGGRRGRLLEIGCGPGSYLMEAAAQGYDVRGIEVSPHAAASANARLGFAAVTAGTLETVSQPADYYEVIALSDVFEHLRSPAWFLKEAFRILKPGGLLFIVTCSLDSFSARISGRYWMEYKVEHLVYATHRAMGQALLRTGFTRVEIQPDEKILTIDYIDQHFQRFRVPILTPLIHLGRNILGDNLANQSMKFTTSGMTAWAVKPA